MLPAILKNRSEHTDAQLLTVAEAARGRALTLAEGFRGTLAEVVEPKDLEELRAWTRAAQAAVSRLIRDRRANFQACQLLSEARLRVERALGEWLRVHVNHSGGGDRRSVSHGATPNADLPEGLSRSDSSRFQQLASIPDVVFERWLVHMKDTGRELTTRGALKLANALERRRSEAPAFRTAGDTATDLAELIKRGQKYGTILADPPWQYDNTQSNGAAENHYPTMTLEELRALPVKELAAADCHLHLWTTTTFLPAAFQLLTAWGFGYKSLFVWVKEGLGLGNYWRVAAEFMLLGVRGEAPFLDHGQPNWIATARKVHSEKPPEIRELIERVSPGPYLELFARREAPGWTVWGNEVTRREVSDNDEAGGRPIRTSTEESRP